MEVWRNELNKDKKEKRVYINRINGCYSYYSYIAAVLVPTVSGYINRSKKTAVITQVRNVITAVQTYNATADKPIVTTEDSATATTTNVNKTVTEIQALVGEDLVDDDSVTKLDNMNYDVMVLINEDSDAIKAIEVKSDGVFKSYTYDKNGTTVTVDKNGAQINKE